MSFETLEGIPKQQRVLMILIVFVAVIGIFFFYPYRNNSKKIHRLGKDIRELERQIIVNKSLAEKKDELMTKNAQLQQKLKEVQQKFPASSEVTSLLKQVSVLSQQSGLEMQFWKPRKKVKSASGLYYEIPVEIVMTGGYHEVGIFLDRVSKLARIVNINNLSMTKAPGANGIVTKCVAKTFSAVSEAETKVSR